MHLIPSQQLHTWPQYGDGDGPDHAILNEVLRVPEKARIPQSSYGRRCKFLAGLAYKLILNPH